MASLGLASWVGEDYGLGLVASSGFSVRATMGSLVFAVLWSLAAPCPPCRPSPGWMKDRSELWQLYWLLDSQASQGSRGQPALTVTSEGWDADRDVGLAPEVLWGLGIGLRVVGQDVRGL